MDTNHRHNPKINLLSNSCFPASSSLPWLYFLRWFAKAITCPVSVGCFCCWSGSPQLTLALCPTEWSHSGFVPQCAGDENGCPLRNSRNFHLALPASVGVHGTEVSGTYEMVSLPNLRCISSVFVLGLFNMWYTVCFYSMILQSHRF